MNNKIKLQIGIILIVLLLPLILSISLTGTGEHSNDNGIITAGGQTNIIIHLNIEGNGRKGIISEVQLGSSDSSTVDTNLSIWQNGVRLVYEEQSAWKYDTAPLVKIGLSNYSDTINQSVDGGHFAIMLNKTGGSGSFGYKASDSQFNGTLFAYASQNMLARHSSQTTRPIFTFNETQAPATPFVQPSSAIIAPTNNTVIATSGERFIVNASAGSYNLTNVTYHIWNDTTKINATTIGITGNTYNISNITFSLEETNKYTWNALTCQGNGNGTNCTWAEDVNQTAYTYIEINAKNYLGELLDSFNLVCADASFNSDLTSPYRTGLSTFTSLAYQAMNCTFTDLTSYNKVNTTELNFSSSTPQYNVSLAQKELLLNFYHYNGTGAQVTGYYSDGNVTGNFTDTNFTQILQNLMQGQVRVMFGWNDSVLNYTQYYEYDNDWITHTEENLTVIKGVDTSAYINVIDESGNPIDDVLVRVAYSMPEYGGTYKEMGQRFTGSDGTSGMTNFYFNSSSDVSIRFTKDGYTARTIVVDIGANTYTFADPLDIILYREETTVYKGVFVRTYNYYNTNMSLIPLSVYAPSRSTAKYTTDFRSDSGSGNATITLDDFKKGIVNMTRGVDYCSGCTDDLVITFYVDGSYWNNITIPFQATQEEMFETPSGLDNEMKVRGAWILLILIASIGGLLLKSSDEEFGSGGKGMPIFFIGAFVISVLFSGEFTFLLIVTLLYGAGLLLRRVIGE